MISKNELREWATPITIGAFALSAVTGAMLFFKVKLSLVKPLHEWLSWVLVFGALLHLIANWRQSFKYISKPIGKRILIFFLALICFSFVPLGRTNNGHNPFKKIADTLIQASLSNVAQAANHSPDEVAAILISKGIKVEGKEQTIKELAIKNKKNPMEILGTIFQDTEGKGTRKEIY